MTQYRVGEALSSHEDEQEQQDNRVIAEEAVTMLREDDLDEAQQGDRRD